MHSKNKNNDQSHYIYENKGLDDKMSLKMQVFCGFFEAVSTIFTRIAARNARDSLFGENGERKSRRRVTQAAKKRLGRLPAQTAKPSASQ